MQKEPSPRELRILKQQLRLRRIRERLGSVLGFKGKTIWDLLQLLIVPALLAGLALWFNNQASVREQERVQLQMESDQKTAEDRAREEALQSYLDRLEVLLLQHDLRTSEPDDEVRSVARARTLTVLRGLDGDRRGALVQFLYESRLIDRDTLVIVLKGADLRGANLRGASMVDAHLRDTNLAGANLVGASLVFVNLRETDLRDADLEGAIMWETVLWDADLRGANLRGANLWSVDLGGADLRGANLTEADLSGAKVTSEQLDQAKSLEGAIMPDGSKYGEED